MPNPPGPPPPIVTKTYAIPAAQRTADQNHLLHMWHIGQWDVYSQQRAAGTTGGTTSGGTTGGTGTGTGSGTGTGTTPTPPDPATISAQHDAITILTDLFSQYDLASLVPKITEYIQNGISTDAVTVLLQQTAEYKSRFAANDIRIKNGMAALSPAEYIATEKSYRQIMAAAGLPTGFYDSRNDFTNLIGNDVSAAELQDRVGAATDAINKAPPETLDYFKQWYGTGDLIAYALDPTKAAPAIEKNLRASEAAALAQAQKFGLTQDQAEHVASKGLSLDQTQQDMSFVGGELPTTTKLDQIYGGNVTQQDLLNEVIDSDAAAAKKRQSLASQERAAFGGQTGSASTSSLASEKSV